MYLEMRRRRWYACDDIPAELQTVIGRRRFVQSLETSDKEEAKRRAGILESRWRTEIARAREIDGIEKDAEYWARSYRTAADHEKPGVKDLIIDAADEIRYRAGKRYDPQLKTDPSFGSPEADRFQAIALGENVRFDRHLEDYLATLKNEAKSVDMKRSTVEKFAEEFPYTADIQRKTVQRWADRQLKAGKALATVRRSLSELRGYWSYLQSLQVVSDTALPFEKLTLPKTGKATAERREDFSAADVVKLHGAAAGDQPLADLIAMAMYTGCRIEELCSLTVPKCFISRDAPGKGFFDVADAKTEAGLRRVPIHSLLAPTLLRLIKEGKDGHVLSGLGVNKYGDRSAAIGKRFGRLKTGQGFGPEHVFHSIRKTVATLLENAGVPESVAAGILGHDHPTMTFGLYSGGAGLEVKRAAIEKLRY